ncbi:MAG: sulfatase-like hydrolase/transferase, partial [Verrucomicrobia bacterium]|nr:sulfatase-like hydrolase/transferase [Verrucomicrobiota bacterium]
MKHLVTLFVFLALLCGHSFGTQPNVLIILADDLGYGELGCQGNTQISTPHIDSLAANGIRFTSGYVSGPVCSPTRSGLMAGRYQQRFGREYNPGVEMTRQGLQALWPKETTFAQHLKSAGYATGMFGKWHLGFEPEQHPTQRGFDEFVGFLGAAHTYLDVREGKRDPITRGTTPLPSVEHTTETFGNEACAFIERHKAEPWFVYLPFNAVHTPMESTKAYLDRMTGITDEKRHTFTAMLTALDDAVGKVLAKLREHRLEENTVIFFLSDNGGPTSTTSSMNKPLRGYKMQTWEGGIRVPFLAQWKGRFPAGKVDDRPIIQLDLLPTALAAAGVEVKPEWQLDGVNLLPFLTGENTAAPHDSLYWRMGEQMAVRVGDWKLVKASDDPGDDEKPGKKPKGGAKLFNLARDISEQHDLAAAE